jgi:hypothetical protein
MPSAEREAGQPTTNPAGPSAAHTHTCLPLGAADAAARYGVALKTVQQWRWRTTHGQLKHPMPPPDWTVSGRPAWCATTLDNWQRPGKEHRHA